MALRLLLCIGAIATFVTSASLIHEGLQPLALQASLIPLQLAALLWVLPRMR